MVVFACNACGEALKKNQVEKHYYTKCRSCNVLSCLDCGKDFIGNEYEQHTKCISEEEKYSGKNFKPRPGANKNEIKQMKWLDQVQQAIEKAKASEQLRNLLVKLKDFPNVPRKEKKFMNFLSSSLNCRNSHLCGQAWKVLMENVEKPTQDEQTKDNAAVTCKEPETTGTHVGDGQSGVTCEETSRKQSKRDRKEERRKKSHKTEKKDKITDHTENGATETINRKKRKRNENDQESVSMDNSMNGSQLAEDAASDDQADEQPVTKKFKTKFNWAEVILEVLQSKGPEMKSKKLKRKVLAEYLSQGCTEHSEEKLWAKFDKRLKKVAGVKLLGDKVKLVEKNR